jgi:hypothetical protein
VKRDGRHQTTTAAPVAAGPTWARNMAKSSRPTPVPLPVRSGVAGARVSRSGTRQPHRARHGIQPQDIAIAQRASGPPAAASGLTWIAAGTLPAGARHAPVGHQRHPQPAILQHRQRRRQRMQFGHPVGLRPLKAHHDHGVGGEFARLERRFTASCVVEHAGGGFDHMAFRGHGRGLDDPACPGCPVNCFSPPVGIERVADRAQDAVVQALRAPATQADRFRSVAVRSYSASPSPATVFASGCSSPASSSCPIV